MASSIRHAVIFCAALFCCLEVSASARTIILEPSDLQRIPQGNPGGVNINTQWPANVNVPGAGASGKLPVPVSKSAQYGWPAIRNAAKSLMRIHPGRAAATAAVMTVMTYLDWEFDGEQFKKPDPNSGALECYWAEYPGSQTGVVPCEYRNSGDACRALFQKIGVNLSHGAGALTSGYCYYYRAPGQGTAVEGVWWREELTGEQLPPIPVTETDLDDFVSNFNDPSQVVPEIIPTVLELDPNALGQPDSIVFTGPSSMPGDPVYTTTLDNVTGNTTVTENLPTHHFEYGTDPLSVTSYTTTVNNTYVNGQQTSSTTTSNQTETPVTQPVQTETPTDCAFMPTVCAFIDWVKTPFTEQAPEFGEFINDEDFEREFNMSGNASCPAPMMINTSKGSYEFSWEPGCEWAALIKPFIIIGALILAIMINLGSFRRD